MGIMGTQNQFEDSTAMMINPKLGKKGEEELESRNEIRDSYYIKSSCPTSPSNNPAPKSLKMNLSQMSTHVPITTTVSAISSQNNLGST
jgi:hypothetical protein